MGDLLQLDEWRWVRQARGSYLQAGAQTVALSAKKLPRGRSGRLKRAGVTETSEVVHGQRGTHCWGQLQVQPGKDKRGHAAAGIADLTDPGPGCASNGRAAATPTRPNRPPHPSAATWPPLSHRPRACALRTAGNPLPSACADPSGLLPSFPSPTAPLTLSLLCHGDTEWPDPGPAPRDPRPGNRPGTHPPSRGDAGFPPGLFGWAGPTANPPPTPGAAAGTAHARWVCRGGSGGGVGPGRAEQVAVSSCPALTPPVSRLCSSRFPAGCLWRLSAVGASTPPGVRGLGAGASASGRPESASEGPGRSGCSRRGWSCPGAVVSLDVIQRWSLLFPESVIYPL